MATSIEDHREDPAHAIRSEQDGPEKTSESISNDNNVEHKLASLDTHQQNSSSQDIHITPRNITSDYASRDEFPISVKPVPKKSNASPLEIELSKAIAVLLHSSGYSPTQEYIEQITELGIEYFSKIVVSLRNFTELQRRRHPSLSDTKVMLRTQGIDASGLYQEMVRSSKVSSESKSYIEQIREQARQILQAQKSVGEDDVAAAFGNEQYEIAELVPKQSKRPIYIPSYLPELPPDYTYQNTPKYMETLTDLKQLRLKLVEESRMTEKSLYDLIEDEERQWRKKFESELNQMKVEEEPAKKKIEVDKLEFETDKKEPKETEKDTEKENVAEDPKKISTSFDFVAYAQKRKQIIERRHQRAIEKQHAREADIYLKAERHFSPYATERNTPEVRSYFKQVLNEGFKTVVQSVRLAEANKKRRIEQILKEKAHKERMEENERNKMEFGFNFNRMPSSDEEEENEEFPQFDMDFDSNSNINGNGSITINNNDNNAIDPSINIPITHDISNDGNLSSDDDFLEAAMKQDSDVVPEPASGPVSEPVVAADSDSDEDELENI